MIEKIASRYQIISKIGEGGMAQIYLAEDLEKKMKVAIKVLQTEKENNHVAIERFKTECELTKKVDSPYVVKIYDYNFEQKPKYIVMEFVDGIILKDYIAKRTRLTAEEVVEFTKQLTLGINEIHNQQIIHRDIKSHNIIVSEYNKIKIIDFGIALDDETIRLTRDDRIIGSVQYLAPEIIYKEDPTKLWDIYALGILMYEMLVGSVPFTSKTPLKTILKHREPVPWVNKIVESIPQSLANIVAKATAKDKTKRYQDMIEFYHDLETCLNLERAYEKPINLTKHKKINLVDLVNSKWLIIVILILLFLMFVTILLVWFFIYQT